MDISRAIKTLSEEWAVISDAPISFALAALALSGLAWLLISKWHSRERTALKAENNFLQAKNTELRTEAERMSKELTDIKNIPQPAAAFGSDAMKSAVVEIVNTQSIKFLGTQSDWPEDQIRKFALFSLLHEAGHAEISRHQFPPQSTVVTSTTSAAAVYAAIENMEKKK